MVFDIKWSHLFLDSANVASSFWNLSQNGKTKGKNEKTKLYKILDGRQTSSPVFRILILREGRQDVRKVMKGKMVGIIGSKR